MIQVIHKNKQFCSLQWELKIFWAYLLSLTDTKKIPDLILVFAVKNKAPAKQLMMIPGTEKSFNKSSEKDFY